MGCCVSTQQKKGKSKYPHNHHQQFSKSPPRLEEESVKEVLTETPNFKPNPTPEPEPEPVIKPNKGDEQQEESQEVEGPTTNAKLVVLSPVKQQQPCPGAKPSIHVTKLPDLKDPTREAISDVTSEMCSLSESISNTTLIDEEEQCSKDNSSEALQRACRSYSHQGNSRNKAYNNKQRSFSGGSSPARRPDPSPQRRRSNNQGQGQGQVGPRRAVNGSTRRSRSPSTRSNVSRTTSGRKTGPSPGRVRMVQDPDKQQVEEGEVEGREKDVWEGPNESLENPLVSLECFIFL